jgi:hypothetical protein
MARGQVAAPGSRAGVAAVAALLIGVAGFAIYLPRYSETAAARREEVREAREAAADEARERKHKAAAATELSRGSTWSNMAKVRDSAPQGAAGGDSPTLR